MIAEKPLSKATVVTLFFGCPEAIYECEDIRMSGKALMSLGVDVHLMPDYVGCDYASRVMTFTRVK